MKCLKIYFNIIVGSRLLWRGAPLHHSRQPAKLSEPTITYRSFLALPIPHNLSRGGGIWITP